MADVRSLTNKLDQIIYNVILSCFFDVKPSGSLDIYCQNHNPISYDLYRILIYTRNKNIEIEDFKIFVLKILSNYNDIKLDPIIYEAMHYFNKHISNPKLLDDLILTHKFVSDYWKHGSKFLHFYTLHNHEHAIELIKASHKLTQTINYFSIKEIDYYILFMSCYLHDISMVKYPDLKSTFLKGDLEASNIIYSNFKRSIIDLNGKVHTVKPVDIKNIILSNYLEVDGMFENLIRSRHANESAGMIRTIKDLDFIDPLYRDIIAEISASHGHDPIDIYSVKSFAKDRNVSSKYIKILLRLSDLLDMSENRITDTILSNSGEFMTDISRYHWISHKVIKGYAFEVEENFSYNAVREQGRHKWGLHSLKQKIKLKIYLNVSNMSRLDNDKSCESIQCVIDDCHDRKKFILSDNKNKCNSNNCPFLCKWMISKNNYLHSEINALSKYLKNDSNYFDTDIVVEYHLPQKSRYLDNSERQFILDAISAKK